MAYTLRRGNRFFCPVCGREVLNWISAQPAWQCDHYKQWVEVRFY